MGQPKQHVEVGGKSFLTHICTTISNFERITPRVFVGQPQDIRSKETIDSYAGIWQENADIDLGPLHSIRLALYHFPTNLGFLLWPIDHPLVSMETVSALLLKAAEAPDNLIIPSDGTKRGHPSYFPPWASEEIRKAPLDRGAKWVLKQFPEKIIHLTVPDIWITKNLNSPERLNEARLFFPQGKRIKKQEIDCTRVGRA